VKQPGLRPFRPPAPGPAPISDEDLLNACAAGNSAALGQLFDRHNLAVYRFLARMLGASDADLDELVSETFIHVFRSARAFRGQAAVRTWISAIAANVGRHHVRSESRRRAFLGALRDRLPRQTDDANQVTERRDLLRRLGALLSALPHDLRVVYVMCDLEEIPGAEVAEALGVPDGTLWRRLHQARRALRAALDGDAG
jgi:RNA polymerase sigma-70 factor (ECF subfamily)